MSDVKKNINTVLAKWQFMYQIGAWEYLRQSNKKEEVDTANTGSMG